MNQIPLLKTWARLQTCRQNLPDGNIEESYVIEYHNIINALEPLTGHALQDFLVPDTALQRTASGRNYQLRYCERAMFLMKIDAAITFLNSLVPAKGERQIGF